MASLRDRDAFTEVGRSFKEGIVTAEEEKERPCDGSISIFHTEYSDAQSLVCFCKRNAMLTVRRPREIVPTNLETVSGHAIIAADGDCRTKCQSLVLKT